MCVLVPKRNAFVRNERRPTRAVRGVLGPRELRFVWQRLRHRLSMHNADGRILVRLFPLGRERPRAVDPSDATLLVAVVPRGGRVYNLRPAAVYDVPNSVYAGLTPLTSAYGLALDAFLSSVQLAWNAQTGTSGSDAAPPATLADRARVWGWVVA